MQRAAVLAIEQLALGANSRIMVPAGPSIARRSFDQNYLVVVSSERLGIIYHWSPMPSEVISSPQLHRAALPALSGQDLWLIAFYAALCMALATALGQDLNWDLLNYHYYNGYLLFEDRFARDVHGAGVQTFINPTLFLPAYAAVRQDIPPRVFFLALAAAQGLALFVVHRIAVLVVPPGSPRMSLTIGLLAATTGAFGATFRSEIGNTMGDNALAGLLLGALWVLLNTMGEGDSRPSRLVPIVAGMTTGAAMGLKLAVLPVALAVFLLVALLPGTATRRVLHVAQFSGASAVGVVLVSGYWMWLMFNHFDSPLFPFFNEIFRSPFAPESNFSDDRFLPRNLGQWLFYPFYWVPTQGLVAEPLFRDARFAVCFVALIGVVLGALLTKPGAQRQDRLVRVRLLMLAAFWMTAYVIWLRMFSYLRYAISLELLTGALVVGSVAMLVRRWTYRLGIAGAVCVTLIVTARPPNWGRTAWSDSYFGVDASALSKYRHATVLMWDFPHGYLIPHFPPSAKFVRLLSNWGLDRNTAMWRRVVDAIQAAPDQQIYLLDQPTGIAHEQQDPTLAQLGLQRRADACETLTSHAGPFRLCAVRRLP